MYRYPLFEFVHDLYKHKNCDIKELLNFERNFSSFLSLDDKQILYNSIGYFYRLKGKIDIAYHWYEKGLKIDKRSLGYAMNAYRIGWIISNRNDNLAAYALVNNALEIFKNHKISEKVKNCKNVLAYISSHAGEFETAISFYLDLIKSYSITDHNSTHQLRGGLLWCYIKNGDYQSVRNTINKIYNEDTNGYDLNLICVIIYFSYLTNDINLFDKWYAYSKQCREDDEVNRSLIELYKYYFYDECLDIIEKRAEKTLALLRHIEDRDEYLMIKELLCKLYAKHNSPKYYDILEELYALERHTLGYYIPNNTTATLK